MNNYFDPNVFKGQPFYSNENIPSALNTSPINNMNYNIPNNEILNINKGKKGTVYLRYNTSNEKEFKGIIEYTNNNYVIMSDPTNGMWYLLPKKYIIYIAFDEAINYINF